jgi:hypothetical protein
VTRFQILATFRGENGWHERGQEEAHSAEQAVKASYMKDSEGVLAMVAVPLRSWRPQAIRTETVRKILLGGEAEPVEKPSENTRRVEGQ